MTVKLKRHTRNNQNDVPLPREAVTAFEQGDLAKELADLGVQNISYYCTRSSTSDGKPARVQLYIVVSRDALKKEGAEGKISEALEKAANSLLSDANPDHPASGTSLKMKVAVYNGRN